jgi:hypothetical protein
VAWFERDHVPVLGDLGEVQAMWDVHVNHVPLLRVEYQGMPEMGAVRRLPALTLCSSIAEPEARVVTSAVSPDWDPRGGLGLDQRRTSRTGPAGGLGLDQRRTSRTGPAWRLGLGRGGLKIS